MWRSEFELRLGDLDGLGHLTATAYLGLFEETRAAWMLGTFDVAYPAYVVASQQITYLREVRLSDGPVTVQLAVREIRTSSFDVVEHLAASSSLRARSTATLVMWDIEDRRPRPISPAERALFGTVLEKQEQPEAS